MGLKAVSGNKGKMGRLFLNGNEFCAEDWDISEVANEEDTTNTCDAGYASQEFGVRRLEGTINASFDLTANPFNSPFGFSVGTKFANTKLYLHADPNIGAEDGPFYSFTLQIASDVRVSTPVRGKVALSIPFVSHGAYTLPTGSDSSGA